MEVLPESAADRVALVRINRSEARNAMNNAVREQLAQTFLELTNNDEVRCVISEGAERVLPASADMKAIADAQPVDMILPAPERNCVLLDEFPKPLIAAVDSVAVESGYELAMHADIIIAGANAERTQAKLKVGVAPEAGGTQRLARAVGKFKALKLLQTGELISAREAEAMGLVTEAVPDKSVLYRALACARAIACMPPIALREVKKLARRASGLPLESALMMERHTSQLIFATADQKDGMRSFVENRSPDFIGL